jgi:hypothetical protein
MLEVEDVELEAAAQLLWGRRSTSAPEWRAMVGARLRSTDV